MVYVAICLDTSISSPRRDKCIFLHMDISKSGYPCPGVLASRCSFLCWKDELSEGARTVGTEETRIESGHL